MRASVCATPYIELFHLLSLLLKLSLAQLHCNFIIYNFDTKSCLPLWQTEEMREKGIEVEFQPDVKVQILLSLELFLLSKTGKEEAMFFFGLVSVHLLRPVCYGHVNTRLHFWDYCLCDQFLDVGDSWLAW